MAKRKIKGLGDQIEQLTKATGIDVIVSAISKVTGYDCGCNERKEYLNAKFPNFKNVNCLSELDYTFLTEFFENNLELTPILKTALNEIYIRSFDINLEIEGCPSCWRDYVSNLKQIYDANTKA